MPTYSVVCRNDTNQNKSVFHITELSRTFPTLDAAIEAVKLVCKKSNLTLEPVATEGLGDTPDDFSDTLYPIVRGWRCSPTERIHICSSVAHEDVHWWLLPVSQDAVQDDPLGGAIQPFGSTNAYAPQVASPSRNKSTTSNGQVLLGITGAVVGGLMLVGLTVAAIALFRSAGHHLTADSSGSTDVTREPALQVSQLTLNDDLVGEFSVAIDAAYQHDGSGQYEATTSEPALKVEALDNDNYRVTWFGNQWIGQSHELTELRLDVPASEASELFKQYEDLLTTNARLELRLGQDASRWEIELRGHKEARAAKVETKHYFGGEDQVSMQVPAGTRIVRIVEFVGGRGSATHREEMRPPAIDKVVSVDRIHTYKLRDMAHELRADPEGRQRVEFHFPAVPGFMAVSVKVVRPGTASQKIDLNRPIGSSPNTSTELTDVDTARGNAGSSTLTVGDDMLAGQATSSRGTSESGFSEPFSMEELAEGTKRTLFGLVPVGPKSPLSLLLNDTKGTGLALLDDFSVVSFDTATYSITHRHVQYSDIHSAFDAWAISANGVVGAISESNRREPYVSKIALFNTKSGKQIREWEDISGRFIALELSNDGKQLAGVTQDRDFVGKYELHRIEAVSGEHTKADLLFKDRPHAIEIDLPRERAYVAIRNQPILQFELMTGNTTTLGSGKEYVAATVKLSPNGDTLAIGGDYHNGRITLLDANDHSVKQTLHGHLGGNHTLCFSTDGLRLMSLSEDHIVRTWNTETGTPVSITDKLEDVNVGSVSTPLITFWTDDSSFVVGNRLWGTSEQITHIRRVRQDKIKKGLASRDPGVLVTHPSIASVAAITPDNKTLIATQGRGVRLYDLMSGEERRYIAMDKVHANPVHSVRVSPDGTQLLTVCKAPGPRGIVEEDRSKFGRTYVYRPEPTRCATWDFESGKCLRQLDVASPNMIGFSTDGAQIVVLARGTTTGLEGEPTTSVHVFDSVTHDRESQFAIPGSVNTFVLTGPNLFVGNHSLFRTLRVRDGKLMNEWGKEYVAHGTAIDPRGKTAAFFLNQTLAFVDLRSGRVRGYPCDSMPKAAMLTADSRYVFVDNDQLVVWRSSRKAPDYTVGCGAGSASLLLSSDESIAVIQRPTGASIIRVP